MAFSEESQASLQFLTGRRWEELAADHDMRCGRCRGGMLALNAVNVQMDFAESWKQIATRYEEQDAKGQWEPPQILPPITTVTLVLRCDKCGAELEMPLDAKEPS